ncbi:MAG TPA: hypothetical protein VFE16_00260 [Candidatus Cybelea sp.]|jgi:hypothetical protein|nr:hypothetical protein [Candidatus Cybelea sp.]
MNATTAAELSAIAESGTLIVILISVVAAVIQLRHIQTGNQLQALLSLERDFRAPELQAALAYIQEQLPVRLEDPAYRRELERIGFVDPMAHPEMVACNWLNEMGTLLKRDLVSEDTFMDLFARLIVHCWRVVSPAIAIMRRTRGDAQYHDFEYLAMRAAEWLRRHPSGIFPRKFTRTPLPDRWRDVDRREAAEG